jgi:hypothetical protein
MVTPVKSLFHVGEDVVVRFRLKNLSEKPIFVSRYMPVGDFITLKLTGPQGKELPWRGKIRSISYSKDAFLLLEQGQEVSTSHTISLSKGEGFEIGGPGRYTIAAEYSLGPSEYFATIAPKGSIPQGSFKSHPVHFVVSTSIKKR